MARHPEWPSVTTFFPEKLERLRNWTPSKKQPYRRDWTARPMAFVCDTGDLFHKNITDEQIWQALDIFRYRDDVDWQLLTKRADRMHRVMMEWMMMHGHKVVPRNIWVGVSAGNASTAFERLPYLMATPAKIKYVSMEPLIGPIWYDAYAPYINWVVIGGESGTKARGMDVEWAREIIASARRWGARFFVKQMGSDGYTGKGEDTSEWPDDLIIQEFPL
jgi:protein gp37